jgi:hypothetical protein
MKEEREPIFKIFSPMRICHNPDEKVLYFHYFNQDKQHKKYVKYNDTNMKYLDALEIIKAKRLEVAKDIYPKLNSNWTGNLNDLRKEYAEALSADSKVYILKTFKPRTKFNPFLQK